MLNFADLAYVVNGTAISLLNIKNKKYLSLNLSNNVFQSNGVHPYLQNKDFLKEIKTSSEFLMVLSTMPNYKANTPPTIITYGTQITFMNDNKMVLTATKEGELKVEQLKEDKTLTSSDLPTNSKFTILDPYNSNNYSKSLIYNDHIVLRSAFGGYISLNSNMSDIYQQDDGISCIGMSNVEEAIWKVVKTNVPYTPDWIFKRKYLNYNYNSFLYNLEQTIKVDKERDEQGNLIIESTRRLTPNINKSKPSLKTLSSTMQDKCLVEDLLLTMLGMEGNYIKRITSYSSINDFKIEFQIEPYLDNPTCDPPLLSMVNLLLPLSSYYDSITQYLNIITNAETGLISKAFSFGIKKLIREYILFVNQLDTQMRVGQSSLNLQQLWWLCQPCLKLLENIHKLCNKCSMIKGGALINIIYSSYLHETDMQMKKMYKFLLDKSFIPYFEMLKNWVCFGVLDTEHEYGEFMIYSHKEYIKEVLNENYLDLFWEMKFRLNEINIPEFLSKSAEKILFIGKSLNIIRECGKIIQCPFEQEFESFSTKEEFNKNTKENENENELMIFENERLIQFELLINKIYEWANSSLKLILFKEKSIESLMKSFKQFYLMECGDFYEYFMESAAELFLQEKKNLIFEKFQVQIDNAIRMTNANSDPNKDQFYFEFTNTPLSMEKNYLDKYSEILISKDNNDIQKISEELNQLNQRQSQLDIGEMNAWECFVLRSKIGWPLNLIFSKKNTLKYNILFRQLFSLKYIENCLNEAWVVQQSLKECRLKNYLKPSYFLRDNMLNFIKSVIYYFFNDVIEPNYIQLKNNLVNSNSLEELMKYHNIFLDNCMKHCLLEDEGIRGDLNNVLQCCHVFVRLVLRYYNSALLSQKDIEHQNAFNYEASGNPLQLKKLRKKRQSEIIENIFIKNNSKFSDVVNKFQKNYDARLKLFLQQIKKLNEKYIFF